MTMKKCSVITAMLVIAAVAQGAIVIDDATVWKDTDEVGNTSFSNGGTTDAGTTHTITAGDPGITPFEDHFFQDGGNLSTDEDYANLYLLTLELQAQDNQPDAVSIYLQASGASWYYNLASPTVGTWTTYGASLSSGTGWYSPTLPGNNFITDIGGIGSVTEVGIRLLYSDIATAGQTYGVRNYTLHDIEAIPEPGTFVVLSTALMSLGFTYARRKKEKKVA